MANMFLTNSSRFKPFSFQEMLQPYQIYTEAYNEADAQLNALYEDAATKAFNFGPNDTKEKAQYDEMMSKLKTASDALVSGDKNAFKTIRNINKEYRQTMIPIQQKMAKRDELVAEQRKLLAANPNLRFSIDYSNTNLDNITGSSSFDVYNLDAITANVKTSTEDLVKGIIRTDFDPIPIGNTSNTLVKTGYGYDSYEFEEQMQNPNSALRKLYDSKIANLDPNMPDNIRQEAERVIYSTMKANAGRFTLDTVIDYSTKPTGSSRATSGGKNTVKPEIYSASEGDPVISLYYNGKLITAEVDWLKDENGEYLRDDNGKAKFRIKPETMKGIPNAKGEKADDLDLQKVQEYYNEEGELEKVVVTREEPVNPGTTPQISGTGNNNGSNNGNVGSKGFRK